MNESVSAEWNFPRPSPVYAETEVLAFFYQGYPNQGKNKKGDEYVIYNGSKLVLVTSKGSLVSAGFTLKVWTSNESAPQFQRFRSKQNPCNDEKHVANLANYLFQDFHDEVKIAEVSYDLGRSLQEQLPVVIQEISRNCTNDTKTKTIKQEVLKFVNFDPLENFDFQNGDPAYIDEYHLDKGSKSKPQMFTNLTSYPRPNGENYYARNIMGEVDVELLRKFRKSKRYCRLSGVPGSGKTALVEAAFGEELITINGNDDLLVSHMVGSYIPNRNKSKDNPNDWIWVDGPLTRAMKEGRPLLIDEVNRIPSGTLDVIIPATDGRSCIILDDLPDAPAVHAKEGFYVVISYNPNVINGRNLDDAILSRFGVNIHVATDLSSLAHFGIPYSAIKIANRMSLLNKNSIDEGGRGVWVPQMRELLLFKALIDDGLSEDFAYSNMMNQCPDDSKRDLEETISIFTENVSPLELGEIVELSSLELAS